jgi:hypothetical protein
VLAESFFRLSDLRNNVKHDRGYRAPGLGIRAKSPREWNSRLVYEKISRVILRARCSCASRLGGLRRGQEATAYHGAKTTAP